MRKNVVQQINTAAEQAGINLPKRTKGEKKGKQPTLLDPTAVTPIVNLMRKHIHWHPYKSPASMPLPDPSTPLTSRYVWLRQAQEMHRLCKELNEGYAWEYLWKNWYDWKQWELWARARNLDYYPIIQSNAPIETHWSYMKNNTLFSLPHIRIDHLVYQIHENMLPQIQRRVEQYRRRIEASSYHTDSVTMFRKLEGRNSRDDTADALEELRDRGGEEDDETGLDDDNSGVEDSLSPGTTSLIAAAQRREKRMTVLYSTDAQRWYCGCESWATNRYHLCKHLVRQYGLPHPTKGRVVRQHRPPLLFIEGFHDESQRHVYVPGEYSGNPCDSFVSLVDGALGEEYPSQLTQGDGGGGLSQTLKHDEKKRKWKEEFETWETAMKWLREEVEAGGERCQRLPEPGSRALASAIKFATRARQLDNERKRTPTWGSRRAGPNLYRS
jgi:hypothetical protein